MSAKQTLTSAQHFDCAHAFPKAMARIEATVPKCVALRDRVAKRPRVAAYLASERRLKPNLHDLFRHYPELDP